MLANAKSGFSLLARLDNDNGGNGADDFFVDKVLAVDDVDVLEFAHTFRFFAYPTEVFVDVFAVVFKDFVGFFKSCFAVAHTDSDAEAWSVHTSCRIQNHREFPSIPKRRVRFFFS